MRGRDGKVVGRAIDDGFSDRELTPEQRMEMARAEAMRYEALMRKAQENLRVRTRAKPGRTEKAEEGKVEAKPPAERPMTYGELRRKREPELRERMRIKMEQARANPLDLSSLPTLREPVGRPPTPAPVDRGRGCARARCGPREPRPLIDQVRQPRVREPPRRHREPPRRHREQTRPHH